jgi:glycine cleavage system H protein
VGVPTDRKYLKSHEWHKVEGDLCVIGITQFAADELTDITFVELPPVGKELSAGDSFGQVESVKSTSDLMCGVSGVVTETNAKLSDEPETINNDPFNAGWMIKVKLSDPGQLGQLLDGAAYDAQVGG